jgi:hypothetical protein
MVDLHELESMAQNSEDVRLLISRATELTITRGITVRPVPLWKILKYDRDGALAHFFNQAGIWDGAQLGQTTQFDLALEQLDFILTSQAISRRVDSKFNLNDPPKPWADLAKKIYPTRRSVEKTPLLVTVMIQLDRSDRASRELSELRGIISDCGLPSIIEEGHDAALQLSSGDTVTVRSKSGVMGGFLHDTTTGDFFGVTCAHVAQVSDQVHDLAGIHIGNCAAAITLLRNTGNVPCDPLKPATPLNKLDVALVEVFTAPPATGQTGTSSLIHGEAIDVRRTGLAARQFNIRSLVMSFQLLDSGTTPPTRWCFERLVELYPQGPVTQPGDSGAWAYNQNGDWAGMIIGGDPISSFVVRYEHIYDWACNKAFSAPRASLAVY